LPSCLESSRRGDLKPTAQKNTISVNDIIENAMSSQV